MADSLADAAQATAEAFTSLNNSINAFTATFKTFAVDQNNTDTEKAEQLAGQIAGLQAQIALYVWINILRPQRFTNF